MAGNGSSSVSVKRIADTSDFERAAASSSTPATRNSKKRRRDECRVQSTEFINRGDQDWLDAHLAKEEPSVPHQIGRRDAAYSKVTSLRVPTYFDLGVMLPNANYYWRCFTEICKSRE